MLPRWAAPTQGATAKKPTVAGATALVAAPALALALAGGTLGIAGFLVGLFENGVAATASAIVGGLDHATATRLLDHTHTGAIARREPLSLLGDIGLTVLAIAAVKAGAAQWTPAAIAVGAIGTSVGFAIGNKPLLLITFTILLVGLARASASLVAGPDRLARGNEVMAAAG